MDNTTITKLRIINQQLSGTNLKTPRDIVSWMGAIQAQDYAMAKWGIGIRLPDSTDNSVEEAFNKGEILRTHVMRPTWHFVAPENIRWMLELTGPRIKSSTKSRDRDLEITEDLYIQSNNIIRKTLEGKKQLTREELTFVLENEGINVNTSRMVHFMMRAELDGIVCSGAMREKKHTYALLDEWVPPTQALTKEEALAKFALTYFSSHGPATLQDFIWWSGLSTPDAREALEMAKKRLFSETIDTQTYWMTNDFSSIPEKGYESVHLLPAFDEYVIAYRDRKIILPAEHNRKAISENGIFRPTLMKNGLIIGIWKKATNKKTPIIPEFFESPESHTMNLTEKGSAVFTAFGKR